MSQNPWRRTFAVPLLVMVGLLVAPAFAQNAHNGTPPGPPAPTTNVLVVNTTAQPVPTTAQGITTVAGTVNLTPGTTVNVGNTPSVTVSNTPNVSVSNVPTVNLASGATLAVTNSLDAHGAPAPLVVTQAPHPYEDSCYFMFSNNSSGTCSFQPIPSGQRLVIQEVDAFMGLDTGLRPTTFYLNTALVHYFTVTVMGTNVGGYDYFATHQETHLYVNGGGSAPLCAVFLSGNSFGGNFHCALTGYLENVP